VYTDAISEITSAKIPTAIKPSQVPASSSAYSYADLQAATSNAVSAIMSMSANDMDFTALGNLGNDLVTSERLLASMPPNLGNQVDAMA
jgi:hypothetical protein